MNPTSVSLTDLDALIGQSIDALPMRALLDSIHLQAEIEPPLEQDPERLSTLSYRRQGYSIQHDPQGGIHVVFVYLTEE